MFRALYFKEWKEKALIFFFELGILALLILAQFVFQQKKDIREWLIYGTLLLFFPFAALILGAAGFETEYRQGAWAYLFSRPVRKAEIWLAKFSALLSMLAALWLVFVALWIAVPGVRELISGPRMLLAFTVESGFPWWSFWQSVFLLTVAFSLSFLHERQFNILFLALIAGLGLTAAAWAVMNNRAGGFMAWFRPSRVLPTFFVFQVLVAVAFAAASIRTIVKSDFSQPRKLTLGFVRWVMPFLVLALAGTAAWALLAPVPGEHFLYLWNTSGGEPYYVSERGVFKYSAAANRVQWLAKAKNIQYFPTFASNSNGKIAYTAFDIKSKNDIVEELWVANADGSSRKRIIGRGPRENGWPQEDSMDDLLISPDGAKVAILSSSADTKQPAKRQPPLWIVGADGTRLENLPDDPALFENPPERYFLNFGAWSFRLEAWAQGGNGVLISKRARRKPITFSLWLYDLNSRTGRLVLDNAMTASWLSRVSPRGDYLAIKYQRNPEKPWVLALLDLKTLETTDITPGQSADRVLSPISWDKKGDRLAYIVRRTQPVGPDVYALAVYSLAEKRTVAEKMMTKSESSALIFWPSWTSDGSKLVVLDREADSLLVFGPDLREIDRIPFPAWLTTPAGLNVVDDQALVEDDKTDSLWCFDLVKKTWKRLY
jgi:hypothetical protein